MGGAVLGLQGSDAVIVDVMVGWKRACEECVNVMAGSREASDFKIEMRVGKDLVDSKIVGMLKRLVVTR
jgi:hypothetical protein